MIDARARWESPSGAGAFRTTQQGHAIYLAELCYRLAGDRAFLEQYQDVVFEAAEFMASFAAWDEKRTCYVLGPPIISGGENTPAEDSQNPMLELSYWAYGLETAQKWREPMERTFDKVTGNLGAWKLWGCDFPMFAMTAARLGKPETAVEMLLCDDPANHYLPNGHTPLRRHLEAYLPANGGLLWAVAMMAAGWDGCPAGPAPGFPANGQWVVRCEGLHPAP
jgi:hypothetical protein